MSKAATPRSQIAYWPPNLHNVNRLSILLMSGAITGLFLLQLVPALMAGLITYIMITRSADRLAILPAARGKLLITLMILLLGIAIFTLTAIGMVRLVHSESGISALLSKMANILQGASLSLPPGLSEFFPVDALALKAWLIHWLSNHAAEMQNLGAATGMVIAQLIIGTLIGSLVSIQKRNLGGEKGPLCRYLGQMIQRFVTSFRAIIAAQFKISAINTMLTGTYLMIILPLSGIHLPLAKTMIFVTFILGLLPIVGNIFSNAMIVIISASHSLALAGISLIYLVISHKIEWLLNAKIMGAQVHSHDWEMLLSMLIMERLFGVPGLVMAPVIYTYIKSELNVRHYL